MRICMFARGMDGHFQSGYRYSFSVLAERFSGRGIDCTVLTTARENGPNIEQPNPMFKIRYLAGTVPRKSTTAYWRESGSAFAAMHADQPFDLIMGRGDTAYGAMQAFGSEAPPLVNHEGSFPPEIMRSIVRPRAGATVLVPASSLLKAVLSRRRQFCLHRAATVVCLSSALANAILRSSWWRSITTEFIPYGIDTKAYAPAPSAAAHARQSLGIPDAPMLLYVGRATETKGVRDGLKVLAQLSNRTARLVCIGPVEPAYADVLETEAIALGVAERVSIAGPKPAAELPLWYSAADLLIFPSTHNEGAPKVFLESMACATPVVAYNLPGFSDLITDMVDGCLLVPGDTAGMARRIDAMLDDPVSLTTMGEIAQRTIASSYSQAIVDAAWDDVFARALAGKR